MVDDVVEDESPHHCDFRHRHINLLAVSHRPVGHECLVGGLAQNFLGFGDVSDCPSAEPWPWDLATPEQEACVRLAASTPAPGKSSSKSARR